MPTIFIAGLAVTLPSRFAEGDIATETSAAMLNDIQQKRISARLRRLITRGEIREDELQAKAEQLMELSMVPYITLDDGEIETDPVALEAIDMAKTLITTKMAREGLPPPKGLDDHARNLVDQMPKIMEAARLRIEARYRASETILAGAV